MDSDTINRKLTSHDLDIYMANSTEIFTFLRTYVDEQTGHAIEVYVSRPPSIGKRNALRAIEAELSIDRLGKRVVLTPKTASIAHQRIAADVYNILATTDTKLAAWLQHNRVNHLETTKNEHESTIARLEKRVKSLEEQVRAMCDEHNAWVVQRQIEAGIDPGAYTTGSKSHSDYVDTMIDAEDLAGIETDLKSDVDEEENEKEYADRRGIKRIRNEGASSEAISDKEIDEKD